MKYILILTAMSTNRDGGVSIHSIEFNVEAHAHEAGRKWLGTYLVKNSMNADFIVVESP